MVQNQILALCLFLETYYLYADHSSSSSQNVLSLFPFSSKVLIFIQNFNPSHQDNTAYPEIGTAQPKYTFQFLWTCSGTAYFCGREQAKTCPANCDTQTCCIRGGGDCGGYQSNWETGALHAPIN